MTDEFFGKADIHIHSEYSHDGFSPIEKILERAKNSGMDLIAITDHNTIDGAKKAIELSGYFGIKVIMGEEIDTSAGDLIGIFIKDFISRGKSPLETAREIHKQGGLAIIPHPFNPLFLGGLSKKVVSEIFEEVDGIEVFNANWTGAIGRKKTLKLNQSIFKLAPLGSSDAHIARQVGRAYTIFKGRNPEDFYFAIKNKETQPGGISWTAADKLLWLINLPKRFFKKPFSPNDFNKL